MSRILGIVAVLCMMMTIPALAGEVKEPSHGAVGQSLYYIVTASGVIKEVKGRTFVFESSGTDSEPVTVSFNTSTEVTLNGKRCKSDEIKAGVRARVTYRRAASQKDGNYTCTGMRVQITD